MDGSTSTRWFAATSVTNAVEVRGENAAQQVAFWSLIAVLEMTCAWLLDSELEEESGGNERVAEPKDASVTNN